MKQRFLMWGLASIVFLVTLAVSSRQEGLWPTADENSENPTHESRPAVLASADPVPLPAQPFGPVNPAPAAATPVVAAATPQPQAAQQPEAPPTAADALPPMPTEETEVGTKEFLSHRDRAARQSARSR